MVLHDKWFVRLALNKCGYIISLLRCQAPRTVLGHVVLNERRHFGYVVHSRAGVVRARTPQGGYRGRFSDTFQFVAHCALLHIDPTSAFPVSTELRKLDEAASWKRTARHLILR